MSQPIPVYIRLNHRAYPLLTTLSLPPSTLSHNANSLVLNISTTSLFKPQTITLTFPLAGLLNYTVSTRLSIAAFSVPDAEKPDPHECRVLSFVAEEFGIDGMEGGTGSMVGSDFTRMVNIFRDALYYGDAVAEIECLIPDATDSIITVLNAPLTTSFSTSRTAHSRTISTTTTQANTSTYSLPPSNSLAASSSDWRKSSSQSKPAALLAGRGPNPFLSNKPPGMKDWTGEEEDKEEEEKA